MVEVDAPEAAPVLTAARPAAPTGDVSGVSPDLLASSPSDGTGDIPAVEPLLWSAAAMTRREFGGAPRLAQPAAVVDSGEPVDPVAELSIAEFSSPTDPAAVPIHLASGGNHWL